jgi:hypothetical protein
MAHLDKGLEVIQHAPATTKTTTEEIGDLIDEIRGIESKPESDAANPLDSEEVH